MNIDTNVVVKLEEDQAADAMLLRKWLLLPLVLVAVSAGLYGRFKGLGTWPLAVDEYYIARSVENILRLGLPEYDCGGFYTRGVVFQYLVAALQLGGLSPELAPRLIAAVSSLLVLPAAFLLGRRLHGTTVGLLAVIVLSLSIWEIEMARFGRMYAPFQAVFAWYLLYFVRYTVDGDRRALLPMFGLSVLGVLVWEGGVFLALTNLLPPFLKRTDGRLSRADWMYLVFAFAVMVPLYLYATNDLRFAGDEPALPDEFQAAGRKAFGPRALPPLWSTLPANSLWLTLAVLPATATLPAVRWLLRFRQRYVTALGLLASLLAVAFHQLAAAGAVLLLLMLSRLLDWRELLSRRALPFWIASITFTAFWIGYGVVGSDWLKDFRGDRVAAGAVLVYQFVRFPDFVMEVVRPVSNAVPMLGLGVLALIAIACIQTILESPRRLSPERALLVLLLCLLLAVSAAGAPRTETRYVFFLYPLAILVALTVLAQLCLKFASNPKLAYLGSIVAALGTFMMSEDFRPAHLIRIDSAEVNFRIGMPPGEASHYHPRSDLRSAGEWLNRNVSNPEKLVINAFPGVDFYFDQFDYTYIDREHQRFAAYACDGGTKERWGGSNLLGSVDDVNKAIAQSESSYLIVNQHYLQTLVSQLNARERKIVWRSADNAINIVRLTD
jgi:Dolichyl-phosphate-mannose-protein mannosyltransferase